ncbi:MAG: RNA-binding protein [Treponema sp.]|nr:RNA-binding protein [Candidatus Treponema equi]
MSKRIYIGNLSFTTNEETITNLFSAYGEVISATIIKDRDTSQSKGFGFVEMDDEADCEGAISRLNGKEVDGRRVRVNYAEEKRDNGPRGGFNRDRGERRGGFGRDRFDRSRRGDRGSYGDRGSSRGEY